MQGRIENKIATESKLLAKIDGAPQYLRRFYLSLNLKTHMTKTRYIENTIRFLNAVGNGDFKNVSIEDLKNIDSFTIEQYMSDINYYDNNGVISELSSATKACIYSSINAFFVFLECNDYISDNPFNKKRIQRPKVSEGKITFLTPEEVKKVEEKILNGCGTDLAISRQMNWKYRDLLLFRIPVITGLRVTALSEINIDDINLENQSIRVTEKGNITKDIYLDEKTCYYIKRWMCNRSSLLWDTDEEVKALFISNQKKRMCVKAIEKLIKKYTEEVTEKHITPHKLRSTCATNLYQAEKDIYLVAEVLGHKTTAPTKRYTQIYDDNKRKAIKTIANLYA